MTAVTSRELGVKLMESLGLQDRKVTMIQLTCAMDDVARLSVEELVETDNGLEKVLRDYELKEKDE